MKFFDIVVISPKGISGTLYSVGLPDLFVESLDSNECPRTQAKLVAQTWHKWLNMPWSKVRVVERWSALPGGYAGEKRRPIDDIPDWYPKALIPESGGDMDKSMIMSKIVERRENNEDLDGLFGEFCAKQQVEQSPAERFIRWLYGLDVRFYDKTMGRDKVVPLEDVLALLEGFENRG